jgi:hypothetical protein
VAGHPTDVRGAPIDISFRIDVEDESVGRADPREVSARRVNDAFRLPGRPRRVEDVEHVLGVQGLGWTVARGAADEVRVDEVAAFLHGDVLARALHDEDVPDRGGLFERLVRVCFQRHDVSASIAAVGGDQHSSFGIVYPVA